MCCISGNGNKISRKLLHAKLMPCFSLAQLLLKQGNRLIIEPIRPGSLLSLLTTLEEITEDFPDVDEELLPLDDITL